MEKEYQEMVMFIRQLKAYVNSDGNREVMEQAIKDFKLKSLDCFKDD